MIAQGNSAALSTASVIPRPMKARRCSSENGAGARCMAVSKPEWRERAVKPLYLIERCDR